MREAIDPIVIVCKPEWIEGRGRIMVRFQGSPSDAVSNVESIYKKYAPEYPFAYTFLDDDFENLYHSETVTSSLSLGFTLMAIIISCLGLVGLAAYTTERKRKEISIRKTLGASSSTLITGMSKDFLVLSLIAAVAGCPIAYLLIQQFLKGYAYHVDVSWDLFLLTTMGVMAVSLLTVIFQVAKASVANPVDALRNE
jgi:ABC-type antimicrobial peptide transport system permease subunit